MTRTEMLKKLETLENEKFMLAMKDYWFNSDCERDNQLDKEIAKIKNALAIA